MKLLSPTPDNRAACLEQLWSKLRIDDLTEDAIAIETPRLQRHVESGSAAKAAMAASDISYRYVELAMINRGRGDDLSSAGYFRKSFAFAYWARELDFVARQDPNWPEEIGDDLLMSMVCWQALSIACGSPWFALWIAPHLHNQFGHPNAEMPLVYYSRDKPARRFMELLQRSLITGTWPTQINSAALSGYGKLLQACTQPSVWSASLVNYCDWRIANAYGYAEMGAPKRRRQSTMDSVLDGECVEQVIPIELFALQFAFERATGQRLTLEASHPMLQSAWMATAFPTVEPLHEDDLIKQLKKLRENSAGMTLPLKSPIVAKYL